MSVGAASTSVSQVLSSQPSIRWSASVKRKQPSIAGKRRQPPRRLVSLRFVAVSLMRGLPPCKLLKNGRADIIDVLGSARRRFLGIAAFKGANHGQVFMADGPQAPVEPL